MSTRRRPFISGTTATMAMASRVRRGAVATGFALLLVGLPSPAQAAVIKEFPTPLVSSPAFITTGPDGNLWFTDYGGGIYRITTAGTMKKFTTPTPGSGTNGIAAGPDGSLWFTEEGADAIGRITTAGVITEFPIPTTGAGPREITAGPDGNLWFTEYSAYQIGRITPSGEITEYPIPLGMEAGPIPQGITAGPDGNLWFTEPGRGKIGRITPAGVMTHFLAPVGTMPYDITAGPDGNLWFTDQYGYIGRITTSGVYPPGKFVIPTPSSNPSGITTGPDGNLWFTENIGNKVGRITTAGVITEFPIPTASSDPGGITAGPDGNLWFAEWGGRRVARLSTAVAGRAYVVSLASGFAPKVRTLAAQGITVQWSLYGPNPTNVLDASGMSLFGTRTPRSFVSFYRFAFTAAGSYAYLDAEAPAHTGTIKVPIVASPTSGNVGTSFTFTWASAPPPLGYVFDVRIKRPEDLAWPTTLWQKGVTTLGASFVPDDGPGTYSIQARLRKTTNGHFSGWSPVRSVTVSLV
jgi:virginiamycin B lyase